MPEVGALPIFSNSKLRPHKRGGSCITQSVIGATRVHYVVVFRALGKTGNTENVAVKHLPMLGER